MLRQDSQNTIIKLILIGDLSVGKTRLAYQYMQINLMAEPTQGLGYLKANKKILDKNIEFSIWDTSGNVKFKKLIRSYYQDNYVYMLVFDITNQQSFKSIQTYFDEINEVIAHPKIVLIANKCDLPGSKWRVTAQEIEELKDKLNVQCFMVSAKSGANVDEVFNLAIELNSNACQPKQQKDKHKKGNFFIRHWKWILTAGITLATIMALGMITFGAVPAMAAALMAVGVTVPLSATLLAVGLIALSGFFAGVFGASAIYIYVDHHKGDNVPDSPRPPGRSTKYIIETGNWPWNNPPNQTIIPLTVQSRAPVSNLTRMREPPFIPDTSRNTFFC